MNNWPLGVIPFIFNSALTSSLIQFPKLIMQLDHKTTPYSARNTIGHLTTLLTGVTTMAGTQHNQTHPKLTWRFLAVSITRSAPRS